MNLLESLPSDVLTITQERDLAVAIQRKQSEDDCNRLTLHNMREAFLYAKGVCRGWIADDELFSLCYVTLARNAKRYKPGKTRFFAFVKVALRGAISRYWTTLDVVKHSSQHEIKRDDDDRIMDSDAYAHMYARGKLGKDESTGESIILAAADRSRKTYQEPSTGPDFDSINLEELMGLIKPVLKSVLNEQEQMLLTLVYKSGFNFQEVGNLLDITRSAAQLSHARAIKKIRNELLRRGQLLSI